MFLVPLLSLLALADVPLGTYPDCSIDDMASCPSDLRPNDWARRTSGFSVLQLT